jgi:hypothetical protein
MKLAFMVGPVPKVQGEPSNSPLVSFFYRRRTGLNVNVTIEPKLIPRFCMRQPLDLGHDPAYSLSPPWDNGRGRWSAISRCTSMEQLVVRRLTENSSTTDLLDKDTTRELVLAMCQAVSALAYNQLGQRMCSVVAGLGEVLSGGDGISIKLA